MVGKFTYFGIKDDEFIFNLRYFPGCMTCYKINTTFFTV